MATVLGLSAFFHDSAAALVVDGKIVAAAQQERFSRIKGDAAFPTQAATFCLSAAGVLPSALDAVVFYESPALKLQRVLDSFAGCAPRGFHAFHGAMPDWFLNKLRVREITRRELLIPSSIPIQYCLHHLSHAASAYYPSPFSSAAVLTIDGVGEWSTASIYHAKNQQLVPLVEQVYPHSLGLLYSAMTSYCGFEVNSGEYKLMGLAAYGEPRFLELFQQEFITLNEDGSLRLNALYFDFNHPTRMTTQEFARRIGQQARRTDDPLSAFHRDLAATVQAIAQQAVCNMARHAVSLTGESQLCFAGGVALNCSANGQILQVDGPQQLFIPPCASDCGGAVGAALWHENQLHPERQRSLQATGDRYQGAFLGPSFTPSECEQAILSASLKAERIDDPEQLCRRVAACLSEQKVVGWFQDAMEMGPRALGHRSILADPRSREMRDRLNEKVKHRETFRPFAPAVLANHADEYFALGSHSSSQPYMTTAVAVKAPELLAATTHIDGTSRIQTVDLRCNGLFARLLQAFQQITSVPILLNTSFNDYDEPIVCTPADAISTSQRTKLDALVLGPFLITELGTADLTRSLSEKIDSRPKAQIPSRIGSERPPKSQTVVSFARLKLISQLCLSLIATRLCLSALWFSIIAGIACALAVTVASSRDRSQQVMQWQYRITSPLRRLASMIAFVAVFLILVCPLGIAMRVRGKNHWARSGWRPLVHPASFDRSRELDVWAGLPWWLELVWRFYIDKQWWLIPLILACAAIALVAQVSGAVSPWIYTLW